MRNAYRPLVAMIRLGPLKRLLKVREGFIRILRPGINLDDDDLDLDRIDVVTASATSRLGNPISDAEQDEAGLYTKSNGMLDVAPTTPARTRTPNSSSNRPARTCGSSTATPT